MAQITLNSTGVASNGALVLQSNGTTTAVTISTAQVATFEKDAVVQGVTVGRGAGAVATNTAVGASALGANTTGLQNTSVGRLALTNSTTGSDNSALGNASLIGNTTGQYNVALGSQALVSNTTASNNTAVGYQAGYSSTIGERNVILGRAAGYNNTGSYNTLLGDQAGYSLTTGTNNVFVGPSNAGYSMTTGSKNTIIGGYSGNSGGLDIRTLSNHIVLSDGDGNVRAYIDNNGYVLAQGVYDRTIANAANVFVLSNGALYRSTSSLKYKHDVQNYAKGLDDLLKLRPVTYKGTGDADGDTVFAGLIAEEVDAVGLTEFVQYADDGSPDALAYGNMVSLCIKAIQELKAEVDSLKAQINGASA